MTVYILQMILFQLLFLLVYETLLKRETFFNYNRWYLLATSVISLLLPFIKIGALAFFIPKEGFTETYNPWFSEILIEEVMVHSQLVNSEFASKMFIINWWLMVYGTGVLLSVFIFFRKFQKLLRLFRFRRISTEINLHIIEVPNSNIACTFYKTIFIGDELKGTERKTIISHELVHVKQKHSLDLLFFELYKIIFWFNPLIYIYQIRIATLHEFIADSVVVKTTAKGSYYEQLLNSAFNTSNISFINQFFNHSLIRKRIVMLQRSKSKSIKNFKFLMLLPVIIVMLTYVACSNQETEVNPQNQDTIKEGTLIQVNDLSNQTEEEKGKINNAIEELSKIEGTSGLAITDGKKIMTVTIQGKAPKSETQVKKTLTFPGK